MTDFLTDSSMLIRALAAVFAVAGWVYGHKKGYSLFGKSISGLVAVWIFIIVGAVLYASLMPDS